MSKIAFVFPGQGAQYVGMGKDLYEKYSSAKRVFDEASEALKLNITDMIFNSDEETLKVTENTQPAILTASIACLEVFKEYVNLPDLTAGLSLGEYSAHVLSGSMSFFDAVKLVRRRGKFMQEEVPEGVGTMAAILGLDNDAVIDVCRQAGQFGIVEPANFNCPGQIVIAGEVAAVEKALEIAKEKGAKRAIQLAVSAPFHCSMLKGAGEKLALELENVIVSDMKIPVVTNVTAKIIGSKDEIKNLLIKQVSSSVLWEDSVRTMLENGVSTFVEIGPGKVLGGFIKKIEKEAKVFNVENVESLESTLKELNV